MTTSKRRIKATSKPRDDFPASVKQQLQDSVASYCSKPDCRILTVKGSSTEKRICAGRAAHITAASENGPRYDASLTKQQRKHFNNGIWLCGTHADEVDVDIDIYTVEELKSWKEQTRFYVSQSLGKKPVYPADDDLECGICLGFVRHGAQVCRHCNASIAYDIRPETRAEIFQLSPLLAFFSIIFILSYAHKAFNLITFENFHLVAILFGVSFAASCSLFIWAALELVKRSSKGKIYFTRQQFHGMPELKRF
jgi:hypothetical protein